MFGYIKPRADALSPAETAYYRSVYCGLCRTGGRRVSRFTRLLLNNDFVFLCAVRTAVCGDSARLEQRRCPYSGKKRCMTCENPSSLHTSAAFGILLYYKALDDISDSRGIVRAAAKLRGLFARRMYRRAEALCPGLQAPVKEQLSVLAGLERARCASPDLVSDSFARLTAFAASYGAEGKEREVLWDCGDHICRYIYIIDAFEDSARDEKKGGYNVLNLYYGSAAAVLENAESIKQTLSDSIHAFCRAYERSGGSVFDGLIYNIAELGSADAFAAALGRLKGTDK